MELAIGRAGGGRAQREVDVVDVGVGTVGAAREALVGQVLELLAGAPEPPFILVSLPPDGPQPNDRRYRVAVVGAGYQGILVSDSTRIPGLVSIADIAPTALGTEGGLRSQPDADPIRTLRGLDERIDGHNGSRVPAGIFAGILIAVLALLWPRAGLLAFGAALLANLGLGVAEASSLWPTLVAIGLAAALGGPEIRVVVGDRTDTIPASDARGRPIRMAPRRSTPMVEVRPRDRPLSGRNRGGLPRRAGDRGPGGGTLALRSEPERAFLRAFEPA